MSQRIIDLRKKNTQSAPYAPAPRVISRHTRVKKISAPPAVPTAAQSISPMLPVKKNIVMPAVHSAPPDAAHSIPHIIAESTQAPAPFPIAPSAPIIMPAALLAPPAPILQKPTKEVLFASAPEKIEHNPHDLRWTSYEHEYRARGPYWFLYPLSIATLAMVFGIITHNYLFALLVAISFAILIYYAHHAPRLLTYHIEKRGVWIEKKCIDFSQIKSFWIYTHPLMAPELLLETHRPLNHILHIRLEHISPDRVRAALLQYLKEVEQKDRVSDQIARIIGL